MVGETREKAEKRGGILVRLEGGLFFVPATATLGVVTAPPITPIPGAPSGLLGVAVFESAIVPVVEVGPARGQMVVCRHLGEPIGLVGGDVVSTGMFLAAPDRAGAVLYENAPVEALDVDAIYARLELSMRPGRWAASQQ